MIFLKLLPNPISDDAANEKRHTNRNFVKGAHPNAARLFMDFIPSKEGQTVLVDFQRIPVRKDVEPKPARLFRGYQRVVERPDDYKYFTDNVKLYEEIFKTR
jgi:ABC-type Fe3+ transport system substrate-binding protein